MKKKWMLIIALLVIVQIIEIGCLVYLLRNRGASPAPAVETQTSSAMETEVTGAGNDTPAETEDQPETTEKEIPEYSDTNPETEPEAEPADETELFVKMTSEQESATVESEGTTAKETAISSTAASETTPPKRQQAQPTTAAPEKTSGSQEQPTTSTPEKSTKSPVQPDRTNQETTPEAIVPETPADTATEVTTKAVTPLYIANAWLDFTPTQFEAFEMSHYHIEVVMSDGSTITDPEGFVAFPQEFHQMLSWVSVTYEGLSYQFEVYAKPNLGE